MRFLICGLGSIGKRHLENLLELGARGAEIAILRRNRSANAFGDEFLKKHKNISVFYDLDQALGEKPEAVFITNPTALHIESAIKAAKAGCHLFLEKPISHSLAGVDELIAVIKRKKLITLVGYNYRFHPLLKKVKSWIDNGKIGQVIAVQAEMSERLEDWHPWEDYKISYAGRRDLGGGAILTQSHELDYLHWLFGRPEWIFTAGGRLGDLRIDTEDLADTIIRFSNNVQVSLHVDYHKKPARRFLDITGTKGRIYWDYFSRKAELIRFGGKTIAAAEPVLFERNTMYLDELKHFLACVKKNKKSAIDIYQGKEVLKMALASKKSMQEKKIIYFS